MRFSIRSLSLRTASLLSVLGIASTVLATPGCSSEPIEEDEDEGALAAGSAQLPDGYPMAWNGGGALPESEKWSGLYANASRVAETFNGGGAALAFAPKGGGGSSVYAFITDTAEADPKKKTKGMWTPPNAATYLPEEIFAFTLSRLFGHSDWAAPATRVTLNKSGADNYEKVVKGANNPGARACNLQHQLEYRKRNPNYFIGVYKEFDPSLKATTAGTLVKNNALNEGHSVVKLLSRGYRKATDAPVYLVPAQTSAGSTHDILVAGDPGYESAAAKAVAVSTEKQVAAQLNHMLVVDLLNGQRDRYGNGTNMGVYLDAANKKFALALIDNGGGSTGVSDRWVNDFRTKVTRFDPELAKNVLELEAFFSGAAPAYKGFTDRDALWRALGAEDVDNVNVGSYSVPCPSIGAIPSFPHYKARWDKKRELFGKLLKIAADHVRANGESISE
jgi:hypothetical protein